MSVIGEPCQARVIPGVGERCGRTDTRFYVSGCQHEHVKERWYCAWHVAKSARGHLVCATCYVHPELPHRCESRLLELAS